MPGRVGVWIIGAYGSVSTCVIVGAEAIKRGLIGRTGLVTDLREFEDLDLVGFDELVFAGCDVREGTLESAAAEVQATAGILPPALLASLAAPLAEVDRRIRRGCALNCGEAILGMGPVRNGDHKTAKEIVAEFQGNLRAFIREEGLRTVIVVNLASTEPYAEMPLEFASLTAFQGLIEDDRRDRLAASVLYAYAAIDAGFAYINFTPSWGASPPAIQELARQRGVPHMGKDGKTGETLVKTVLAPMFVARNLKVLSWSGHNILGNRDGLVLKHPENNKNKVKDKDEALRKILRDDDAQSHVRIDYVPSLGDWKTAWDHIHFQGFLDVRMTMQFTWQGCDSALAAPLVLDMIRLAEFARRRGESGTMPHLACFFKSPLGVEEHDFHRQFDRLLAYVEAHRAASPSAASTAVAST